VRSEFPSAADFGVARRPLDYEPDAAALELQFAQALDHDIRIAPVAAVADVLDSDLDLAAHRFGMGAAHRVDQGRLAFERHHDVA
jgi:hypothetical protein